MTEMTSRERMLAAMRLEQPDCVPVAPDVSNMIPCRLTGKPYWDVYLHKSPPIWKAYLAARDHFGFDGWLGYAGMVSWKTAHPIQTEQKVIRRTDERLVVGYRHRTPAGDLTEEVTYFHDDPPHQTGKMIKDLKEDFPKVRCLLEEPIGYDDGVYREVRRLTGEKGIVCIRNGTPGLHDWAWPFDGGLEPAVYAYYDHSDIMQELAELQRRMYLKQCEMVCDVHPDVIVTGGSGLITMQSPDLFRELSLPTIREETRIARQAGIVTMIHSCGKEREVVRMCAEETDLNCIIPLETPPMGDCDLADLKKNWGSRICLMGNLHTTDVMLNGTPAEVEAAAKKAIDDAGAGGGFILSTGDQCGRDTPDVNIFKLIEVARTYGKYPSAGQEPLF